MPPDEDNSDTHYTYNTLTNEEKELLLRHGYVPGELPPEEERDLIEDLKSDLGDEDEDRLSNDVSPDERDGTQ